MTSLSSFSRSFLYRKDPSLVLYLPIWLLDGSQFMSRDAYGHLVTKYGSIWTPQGYSFDGVDDYLSIPSSSLFLTQQGAVQVVFKTQAGGSLFAAGKSNAAYPLFIFEVVGGKIGFEAGGPPYPELLTTEATFADNNWHVAFFQSDGSINTCWVDGIEKSMSGTNTGIWYGDYATDTIAVGVLDRLTDYGYFNGLIAEVMVYNRTFSPPEILNYYLQAKRRLPWL